MSDPSDSRGSPPFPAPTVAVVGAGFSGLLTAVHLLSQDPGVRVRLVERAPRFGRGRAYEAAPPEHLLNVRAANMSAFPDRPGHFLDWLAAQGGTPDPDGFVSRRRYGDYLQDLLRRAVGEAGARGRLLLEHDACVDLAPSPGGYDVRLAVGRSFPARAVVLALGAGPPPALPGVDPDILATPLYVADPWRMAAGDLPDGEILLIGSGLTMIDVALSLAGPRRRLTALSRRGLSPRRHAPVAVAAAPSGPMDTPLAALMTLRAHAREVGWRAAVDGVRPLTADIWRAWPLDARRTFLRHLAAWWDVYRHRMAPEVAARVATLQDDGDLQVRAGRLEALAVREDGLSALVRLRGRRTHLRQAYAAVVNCSGLSGRLDGADGLLRTLLLRGLIRPDPLGLGADVDDAFHLIGRRGLRTPYLWAVGPLARAARWETLAVPDLRAQTAETASAVIDALRDPRQTAPHL
jgi:uncharacterized NAD(P)/FAD-binding protein YdhS